MILLASAVAIYRFDGVLWTSAAVAGQGFQQDGGVITATGTYYHSGPFGLFYSGHDSSAPVTTFSLQGSSTVFDGAAYVSTSSYIVLTATDPVVNGYASQVSTIYYRLDDFGAGASFSVYTDSVPLPLGPHVLEYRTQDYAGNFETIKYSTFIVTAGTVFKQSGSYSTSGNFLAGFLDYGVKADIQSRAENDYTLLVSSPNYRPLLAVDNIGNVSVGTSPAQAILDIQGTAASGDIAIQLRSGNSTATPTSRQITFGYNGGISMRHAIRTKHSAATDVGTGMDFLLWGPATGSTATIGNLNVMTLTTGSVHVHPAGDPDVELEVSDGSSVGGGTIHRLFAATHSSRELKTDIRYLSQKEETQAYQDVIGLKHARFRYKVRTKKGTLEADPRQPLWNGLIHEDAPKSIRGSGNSIIIDERVVNLELALKEASRELDKLERRLKELQK